MFAVLLSSPRQVPAPIGGRRPVPPAQGYDAILASLRGDRYRRVRRRYFTYVAGASPVTHA